jgi:cytochrome c551/c552
MSMMQAPPSRPPAQSAEPSGFTLFLLFVGSLVAAGAIGLWLWNSNPSVRQGRAFGTQNQLAPGGKVSAGPAGGAEGQQAGPEADPALVSQGQQLASQLGCTACHTATGQQSTGPTWKGLAGSERQLDNGQTVIADDEYLKESILQPDAKIVRGFSRGIMASAVSAAESQIQQGNNLDALVAYIKSLK